MKTILETKEIKPKQSILKHKDGTDIPKNKWGTKQGNWQKVHPLDR